MEEGKTETKASAQQPQTSTKAAVDTDPTLSSAEYEARGMPPIQNPWSVAVYQQAVPVLTTLRTENPALLPRFSSKRSGEVFRRMVSRENLQLYTNKDMDWTTRRSSLGDLLVVLPSVMGIYGGAVQEGQPLDREMLEATLHQGHAMVLLWHTFDEVAPTMYKKDEGLSRRMMTLQLLQQNAGIAVLGMIGMSEDQQRIRLENRIWYISELAKLLPDLANRAEQSTQNTIRKQVARLVAAETAPELKKQLESLQSALATLPIPAVPRPAISEKP